MFIVRFNAWTGLQHAWVNLTDPYEALTDRNADETRRGACSKAAPSTIKLRVTGDWNRDSAVKRHPRFSLIMAVNAIAVLENTHTYTSSTLHGTMSQTTGSNLQTLRAHETVSCQLMLRLTEIGGHANLYIERTNNTCQGFHVYCHCTSKENETFL